MTKHALNAFLATSVAFINEIAGLCERLGADALEVERGLKSDSRIGPGAYLHPGSAFAGGTLARDVSFLMEAAQERSLPCHLLHGVRQSNHGHKDWVRRRLTEVVGPLAGKTIALLGLTYKPGTDTLRRSDAVELAVWLRSQAADVHAFDPAVAALPEELRGTFDLAPRLERALERAHAAVIATAWPEFQALSPDAVLRAMRRPVILDPARHLERTLAVDGRIEYFAVGTGGGSPASRIAPGEQPE
jgi:UDPglucose 6-dehydrogenase